VGAPGGCAALCCCLRAVAQLLQACFLQCNLLYRGHGLSQPIMMDIWTSGSITCLEHYIQHPLRAVCCPYAILP
jgi:hypothetical protein